jgi:predicted TIM-barrel fold metal-dependent hydrolase
MVVDFHTHCFPNKIARRALEQLASHSGGMEPFHDGDEHALARTVRDMGADYAVVLNIATNPKQQRSVNDYAIAINNTNGLVAFGSVHPDSPDALEELERLKDGGVKGIKLHPDYQKFFVDEQRMFPIYKKAAALGLITVFHAGVDIGLPDPVHCPPEHLAAVLPLFDGAPVVAAHFGGYMEYHDTVRHLVGKPVYLDTSYSFSRFPLPWARELIRLHGADNILFGSDMPWSSTRDEMTYIKSLRLPEEDEGLILGGNAQKLLDLPG